MKFILWTSESQWHLTYLHKHLFWYYLFHSSISFSYWFILNSHSFVLWFYKIFNQFFLFFPFTFDFFFENLDFVRYPIWFVFQSSLFVLIVSYIQMNYLDFTKWLNDLFVFFIVTSANNLIFQSLTSKSLLNETKFKVHHSVYTYIKFNMINYFWSKFDMLYAIFSLNWSFLMSWISQKTLDCLWE